MRRCRSALALVLALGACAPHAPPRPAACGPDAPAPSTPGAPRDVPPPTGRLKTVDARSAEIARRAPGGYAGIHMQQGRLVLLLADTSDLDVTLEVLGPVLGGLHQRPLPPRDSLTVRKVRWNFAQLFDWARHLDQRGVWTVGTVTRSHIDEVRNQLVYGVPDAAAERRLAAWLRAHGVPCGLVLVRIQPGIDIG